MGEMCGSPLPHCPLIAGAVFISSFCLAAVNRLNRSNLSAVCDTKSVSLNITPGSTRCDIYDCTHAITTTLWAKSEYSTHHRGRAFDSTLSMETSIDTYHCAQCSNVLSTIDINSQYNDDSALMRFKVSSKAHTHFNESTSTGEHNMQVMWQKREFA